MGETVSVADAKRSFSELVRRASRGERILVTIHGRPIAQIVPPDPPTADEREAAIERILELRKGNRLGGLSWKEMVNEGRP